MSQHKSSRKAGERKTECEGKSSSKQSNTNNRALVLLVVLPALLYFTATCQRALHGSDKVREPSWSRGPRQRPTVDTVGAKSELVSVRSLRTSGAENRATPACNAAHDDLNARLPPPAKPPPTRTAYTPLLNLKNHYPVMANLTKGEYDEMERERLANSRHRLYGYALSDTLIAGSSLICKAAGIGRIHSTQMTSTSSVSGRVSDISVEPSCLTPNGTQWRYALVRGRSMAHIVVVPWATLAMRSRSCDYSIAGFTRVSPVSLCHPRPHR